MAGRVVLIDSITEVRPDNAGDAVVSGSHAGISAARFALAAEAGLYAFNDAGLGKDRAGVAGLSVLDARGIAAVAVGHDTARIGEAADTLASGRVTFVNGAAERAGALVGERLADLLARLGYPL